MIMKSLIIGAICGAVIIGVNTLMMNIGFGHPAAAFGVMFVVLSAIFFWLRSQSRHGISFGFGSAFGYSLLISLAATGAYVGLWELYMNATDHNFYSTYADGIVAASKEAGVTGAELEAVIADVNKLRTNLADPSYRLPMTAMEILPVGLVVSLVSGFLLRK